MRIREKLDLVEKAELEGAEIIQRDVEGADIKKLAKLYVKHSNILSRNTEKSNLRVHYKNTFILDNIKRRMIDHVLHENGYQLILTDDIIFKWVKAGSSGNNHYQK